MNDRIPLHDLPTALRRLRLRAGHKTQRSALRAIRGKTGVRITPSRMSNWEMGRSEPTLRSLLAFLNGLDLTLVDLQQELERAAGEADPERRPAADPAAAAPADEDDQARLSRRVADLEQRLRSVERQTPGEG